MDLLDVEKVEQEVKRTIDGLESEEKKNKIKFNEWPKNAKPTYEELRPERRDQGLSEPSRRHLQKRN